MQVSCAQLSNEWSYVSAIIYMHLCACIKINIQKSNLNIIYQQINTEQQLMYALLTQYSLTKANSENRHGSSVPDRWFQRGFKLDLINSSSPSPRQDIMLGVVTRLETMIMQIYESEGANLAKSVCLSLFSSITTPLFTSIAKHHFLRK